MLLNCTTNDQKDLSNKEMIKALLAWRCQALQTNILLSVTILGKYAILAFR